MTEADLPGPELEEVRRMFALLRGVAGTHAGVMPRTRMTELAELLVRVVSGPLAASVPPGARELTAREIDVLAHAAIGATNSEIAGQLGVSAETVKSYLRSAMGKLRAHSRHAAVEHARAAGAIP